MSDPDLPKPKLRWYQFSLRTLLVLVSEASRLSARRLAIKASPIWSTVFVFAVLTGGLRQGAQHDWSTAKGAHGSGRGDSCGRRDSSRRE